MSLSPALAALSWLLVLTQLCSEGLPHALPLRLVPLGLLAHSLHNQVHDVQQHPAKTRAAESLPGISHGTTASTQGSGRSCSNPDHIHNSSAPNQHTGTGGKSLYKSKQEQNLLSQILLLSYPQPVPFVLCRLSTTDTCRNSQSWDSSGTHSSACLGLPKPPANPGAPPGAPIPTAYLRSVLSAREMAGFLTALEQAALLLQRENSSDRIWGNSDSAMGTPRASSKP